MTSKLAKINEAIKASRSDMALVINEDFNDDTGMLFISGVMDQDALNKWGEVCDLKENWLKVSFIDDYQDPIHPSEGTPGSPHKITLSFSTFEENHHIFTEEGWKIYLYNDRLLCNARNIYLAFIDNGFETFAYKVFPWTDTPSNETPYSESVYSPSLTKGIIKCYSSDFIVPEKVTSWILKSEVSSENVAQQIWINNACRELLKCLANELYISDVKMVGLSGKPPRKISFGNEADCVSYFNSIQSAAKWVYIEGEEIELKHTFLTNELAREWPDNIEFCKGIITKLSPALESARLLYKAHIRASSKDTIRALGDLRKNLADDTQKIVQQSRDLTSSIWKDVALTISTIVIKYTLDAAKAPASSKIYAVIFFAIAIYIIVSNSMNLFINKRFMELLERNRLTWRQKLYGFLDDKDYKDLASEPIEDSYKTYESVKIASIVIVSLLSTILILIGLNEFFPLKDLLFLFITELKDKTIGVFDIMANTIARH
ncbi:hypothetical protein GE191_12225 [Serratia fonticola]|uniref:hypothetical protein n=1 Tax=Serratia fonticola TaxID=47917 RepID=UPI00137716DF|nr:hypothetical protein [Serratia fonticola]NBJ34449.1 hypothetical protein [Serratia fonticola]